MEELERWLRQEARNIGVEMVKKLEKEQEDKGWVFLSHVVKYADRVKELNRVAAHIGMKEAPGVEFARVWEDFNKTHKIYYAKCMVVNGFRATDTEPAKVFHD